MQYATVIAYVPSNVHFKEKNKDLILREITVFSNSLSSQRQENCSDK